MPRAIVDINPGQRPDEDPSLAVRNNGGTPPSAAPAPAGPRAARRRRSLGGPEGAHDGNPLLYYITP
ncbi:ferrochelatase, partial [Geodermatophilus sp. SYSU D00815]